jgi:type 1 fimbriae regulatory protein FimB/type 1 fimbriae regulatory protein FimE
MAPTLRDSRDFGTSKDQLEEGITPFRTIAEDRNAIRAAVPSLVGEMGHRDATMITVAYRHPVSGERAGGSPLGSVGFAHARLHVRRVKQGTPATHPIPGDELRALRELQRERAEIAVRVYLGTGRHSPRAICQAGGARWRAAGLGFPAHPHAAARLAGFALANKRGEAIRGHCRPTAGHRNIQHAVR